MHDIEAVEPCTSMLQPLSPRSACIVKAANADVHVQFINLADRNACHSTYGPVMPGIQHTEDTGRQ